MFGMGFGEMVVIAAILLLAVGPRQLPVLMKTVGKGLRDIRRASNELVSSSGLAAALHDEGPRPSRPRQAPRVPEADSAGVNEGTP